MVGTRSKNAVRAGGVTKSGKSAAPAKTLKIKLPRKVKITDVLTEQARLVPSDAVAKRTRGQGKSAQTDTKKKSVSIESGAQEDGARAITVRITRSKKKIEARKSGVKTRSKTAATVTKAAASVEPPKRSRRKKAAEEPIPEVSPPKTRKKAVKREMKEENDSQKPGPSRKTRKVKETENNEVVESKEEEPSGRPKRKAALANNLVKSPPKTKKKAATGVKAEDSAPKTRKKVKETKEEDAKTSKNEKIDNETSQTAKIGKTAKRNQGKLKATAAKQKKQVRIEEEPPQEREMSQDEADLSDKENFENSRNVSKSSNTSGEKKPIYKIVDAKPSNVPMEQLIVEDEQNAGASDMDVYSFELSQNGNEKKKKKKRKVLVAKHNVKKLKKPKMWDSKDLKKMQKKSAAVQRADKLKSIPAHILEKIKGKELLKQSLMQSSTPFKDSTNILKNNNIEKQMSPIMSGIGVLSSQDDSVQDDDNDTVQDFPVEPENDPPQQSLPGNNEETRAIAEPQPWRNDESIHLPTTSHIKHSGKGFLPTYSSDMIVKATPRKPKPSPKVPQAAASPAQWDKTFNVKANSEAEQDINYTIENYFGFDSDAPIEVNMEVAKKHDEEALEKERERVRKLVPAKKSPRPTVELRKERPQRAVAQEPVPSTSKSPVKETSLPENLFLSQEPEEPRRNYSRPKKTKEIESEDEPDAAEEAPVKKKATKEGPKKYKSKTTVSKKDQKHLEELEEFYTSFNEECAEVEKFELIIEPEKEDTP